MKTRTTTNTSPIKLLLLCINCLTLISCASIIGESNKTFNFSSTPSKAEIWIENQRGEVVFNGFTPAHVTLVNKLGYFQGANYTVHVKKKGFQPHSMKIKRSINAWYWGNIIFGGAIGMLIIDPATGSMWTLSTDTPVITLKEATTQNDNTLSIITFDQLPSAYRDQLLRIN